MGKVFDVIIVGGGIVGTATLDRLARYDLDVLLVEKSDDVAAFSTRANSGIVHAGYDCEPGTLKAKFNVLGNALLWKDAEDLDVEHLKCGSIVVAKEDGKEGIERLAEKAKANGVEVEVWDRQKTLEFEPNIADDITMSLYAKSAGIVSPYQLAIAYADRAILNGASILLESEVKAINKKAEGFFEVITSKGAYLAKVVVNCAGENGAGLNDMAGAEHYDTEYRRGDYFILDNVERKNVHTVIFPLPTKAGKGILVAPTADGNVIYGPTSIATEKDDTASSLASLDEIRRNVPLSYKTPAFNKCIRIYSGLRTIIGHDFVIGESKVVPNFIMAIGICSPGLTSAPAIAEHLRDLVVSKLDCQPKANTVEQLPKTKRLMSLDEKELNELVAKDEAWGRIVCRCEKVTEAEVVRAIHSPLPATTVDAVKRRTRAGMGRCQGGFCGPRVMEIISRELGIPLDKVRKGNGEDSNIAVCKVKEVK
ncbi:MAG: NAD(P)/FAD-dependent oxidoreductase [Clostridia bacterium]|nr:NAD(P)/FAD-dependent oxidoreductase [Clostridia bacterium]